MVSELRLEALLPSYSCFVPFFAKRAKRPGGQAKTIPGGRKNAAKSFFGSIPCRKVPGVFFLFSACTLVYIVLVANKGQCMHSSL